MRPRRIESTKTGFRTSQEKRSSYLRVFLVSSLLMGGHLVSAQAPTTPDDGKREFTVSGCLLRNGYAGYQIDPARVEAIDGKAVAAPSTPATAAAPGMPNKWILDGGGNLGTSTGKKVEVIGRSDWQPPSAPTPDEPPNRTPHLDVKSVKTIAPTCS